MKTELETTREEKRAAFVRGLREFAEFLETTPEAPLPVASSFNVYADSANDFAKFGRTVGGYLEKHFLENWVYLTRRFGPIRYEINIERPKVCERRVVETRVIPEMVIPEQTVEVVEWVCAEPILKNGGGE